MLKRLLFTLALVALVAGPSYAQRKENPKRDLTPSTFPQKSTPSFLATFKPVVEKVSKSTVRVLLDNKDIALGTVVTSDGGIITKASEIKAGALTVKTVDGKQYNAKLVASNETYDLGLLKIDADSLVPVSWALSKTAPVGNWIASAGASAEPVAVGVVSVAARTLPPPYGPPRVPTEQSGFLGVSLDPDGAGALIGSVTAGSAAEKAGIKAKDVIISIDKNDIINQESLINTLLGYRAGDTVKVLIEREGKRLELQAVLGKRPSELVPGKGGKGGSRGDLQNNMGSILSERRTGFPIILQHDAVVKHTDCGGPLVDLDGQVIGVNICRGGRTETHALPSETVVQVLQELLATKPTYTAAERVAEARAALTRAEAAKAAADKRLADARKVLESAVADEKWWKDHPAEKGPAPREVKK